MTRFSGRLAPEHPGGVPHLPDAIVREAYSHEVSSCGFWPGNEAMPEAVFYFYAYPASEGFTDAKVQPSDAFWNTALREFVLPYPKMRQAENPDCVLLEFLQTTYEAAARLGKWNCAALERSTDLAPHHSQAQS